MQSDTEVVVEKLDVEDPIVITGFPGVGLVGTIASSHIVSEYNLEPIGYIESEELPPVTTLIEGVAVPPIRIYQLVDNGIVLVHSDVPIGPGLAYGLVSNIVKWAASVNAKRLYSLAGVATFEGKNRVFGAATSKDLLDGIADHVEVFKTGTITGAPGSLLNECVMRNYLGLILLGETYGSNPDPRSAAQIVEVLNKIFSLNVNTERLMEEAEYIEAQMQKLADQTRAQEEKESTTKQDFPMFG